MSNENKKSLWDRTKEFFGSDTGKGVAIGGTITFIGVAINYFLSRRHNND